MGQTSSMCNIRGCRRLKSKSLPLRSIEEPQGRMVVEQGPCAGKESSHSTTTATTKCGNGLSAGSGPLQTTSAPVGTTNPGTPTPQTPQLSGEQNHHHYNHPNHFHHGQPPPSTMPGNHHPNSNNHHPLHNHHPTYRHHHHQRYSSPVYNAEHARMEAWMDENQEFMQDYIIRKATRQVVDAWLVNHATPSSSSNDLLASPTHHVPGCSGATGMGGAGSGCANNCSSRGGSGATTPVRKISAHEFERGGLLKPIVNTIDGTPTFLSVDVQNESQCLSGGVGHHATTNGGCGSTSGTFAGSSSSHSGAGGNNCGGSSTLPSTLGVNLTAAGRPQRLSRNELKQLDERELIFELVKDICNELDVRSLCHKILQNVSMLLNADRGSLFLVQGRTNGASGDGPKRCLVSKLFDVCPRSTVEEMEHQDEVRVAWGTGIAGYVAESGDPVNIPDAYQDDRFNNEIDILTGYRTKALLCMPIKDGSGDVVGVAQVINKLDGARFTENDEKIFASYLQFCGIGLRNAQLYEKSQLEVKRNQVLLDLARMIFEEQSTIEHMVFRILTHMQSLIQCQRVQILLVHEANRGSFSRVFDFEANDLREDNDSRTSPFESRFPINIGITGLVATNGGTINIPNAYEDDRFDASVDEGQVFKHKSILCMAIKNSLGQIIGVIQLVNKFENLLFTKNDENFVEAFAIFCGMGIHNTHMYEKAIVAMAKQSVTLEVLSYHASASIDDAVRLRIEKVPSAAYYQLHDFRFDDLYLEDDDTLKACLRMFLDLDLVERFHIDYEVLCRWLLSVKKNYRHVTYHNWRHAFNVAQMMFAILTETQWWKIFGEIECLGLIIACLCHDLDHRGTNNSFQIKASSPLAQLYSTSTMEHHHFDQCLMILNSPGNQILSHLSSVDYSKVIRVLEDAILSTDLAVYFRKRGPFLSAVKPNSMNAWLNDEPRGLLRAMSMTVCDLSAITKPWDIEKRVADLVTHEFFEQGDMERDELKITPIDIMNREKEDELPMMQVGFIDSICMPIYEAFAVLSPKLIPLVNGVRNNKDEWLKLGSGSNSGNSQSTVVVNGKANNCSSRLRKVSASNCGGGKHPEHQRESNNCNGNYFNSEDEEENDDEVRNNNNLNIDASEAESSIECKNCSPIETRRGRQRRVSREESGARVINRPPPQELLGESNRPQQQQNGDTMKCTVCRSNSNGFRKGRAVSEGSSSSSVNCSGTTTNTSNSSSNSSNGSSSSGGGGGVGANDGSHNNQLNINNNNSSHSIGIETLSTISSTSSAAEGGVVVGNSQCHVVDDAASLINNDSCARTPKIVGKLGNLDSTQLLLSANINHNHHEQQFQSDEEGEEEDGNKSGHVVKSVEWKGSGEEQRQVLMENHNNNNNDDAINNLNNIEEEEERKPELESGGIMTGTMATTGSSGGLVSLRRRKSGSANFCEVPVGVVTEMNRRKESNERLPGVEDSVSVVAATTTTMTGN